MWASLLLRLPRPDPSYWRGGAEEEKALNVGLGLISLLIVVRIRPPGHNTVDAVANCEGANTPWRSHVTLTTLIYQFNDLL